MALNSDIFHHDETHPCYSSFPRRTIFVHKVTKLFTEHTAKPQWLKFFICRDAAEQQKQPESREVLLYWHLEAEDVNCNSLNGRSTYHPRTTLKIDQTKNNNSCTSEHISESSV